MPKSKPTNIIEESKSSAIDVLTKLLGDEITLQRLDQVHDTLRLFGVVLGQMALLDVVSDPIADATAKVSAAKALLAVKEDPDSIAERLRRSVFSGLTVEQLSNIMSKVKQGENLQELLKQLSQGESHTPA